MTSNPPPSLPSHESMTSNPRPSLPSQKPVWFITGCSTGFGRELATQLFQRGYRTVVTARDPREISALAALGDALI